MKRVVAYLLAVLIFITVSGCNKEDEAKEYTFFGLNTVITYKGPAETAKEVESLINDYENLLSVTRNTSDIYKINEESKATVSDVTSSAVNDALNISKITDGAFDFTLYPVSNAWGFTKSEYRVVGKSTLAALLEKTGYENVSLEGNKVSVPQGFMIDLGGIAKGIITDKISSLLTEKKVESALVSLGGNVYTHGKKNGKKWNVAIRNPFEDGNIGTVEVSDMAVITSGGYERNFTIDGKEYHHIIDPATGYPAHSGLSSVTIVSKNATLADGLSTGIFVMGYDKGVKLWQSRDDFDMILVDDDGKVYVTEGISKDFKGKFTKIGK